FNTSIRKAYSFFLKKIIIKYPIVIPSKYYEEIFLNQFKKVKEELLVYPSGGINSTIFKPLKMEPPTNQFVIGFVSNFIEKKGWRVLLDAIDILIKENAIPNISLRLVGDGPDKEEILKRVKNLNIPYTLRSNLSQAELAEEYNLLDVFVFPTYRVDESLGLVGLEAMSCGVPVIASNMGGPKGYINSGVNGLLFTPKDADDLASKMMTYNNYTGDKKTNMIKSAEKTAADYDSKKVKNELITFLKNQ
ncbi:MAG: glycosyltransferase, partial [Flavobacteriaceae bacterium]|nr:glycosyltransferase [Flavobacteriaceae bacterium]